TKVIGSVRFGGTQSERPDLRRAAAGVRARWPRAFRLLRRRDSAHPARAAGSTLPAEATGCPTSDAVTPSASPQPAELSRHGRRSPGGLTSDLRCPTGRIPTTSYGSTR